VCLEEYVDGVSRVMSLPCGHEFHVDCITPWLTTRRRTCPICKGDVVRGIGMAEQQEDNRRSMSGFAEWGMNRLRGIAGATGIGGLAWGGSSAEERTPLIENSAENTAREGEMGRLSTSSSSGRS